MIKMRCLQNHSSMTYGSLTSGQSFAVDNEGYADHLVVHGLAARVVDPALAATIEELITAKPKRKKDD